VIFQQKYQTKKQQESCNTNLFFYLLMEEYKQPWAHNLEKIVENKHKATLKCFAVTIIYIILQQHSTTSAHNHE
jgi:hypothetical protein